MAIGDIPFKLAPIYTERVLALATPPFHENYKIGELITRNRTPPYLSNRAEIKHVDLATVDSNPTPILILCSDGLYDCTRGDHLSATYQRRPAMAHHHLSLNAEAIWLWTSCGMHWMVMAGY